LENLSEEKYQDDSIRLAEVRMEAIADSIQRIEKKAILAVAACAALLGYLFSQKIGVDANASSAYQMTIIVIAKILQLIAFALLVASACDCAQVLRSTLLKTIGLHPETSVKIADFCKTNQANEDASSARHHILITEYTDKIGELLTMQEAKVADLQKARHWLFWGFACVAARMFLLLLLAW